MKKIKMIKKVEIMNDGRKMNVYQFEVEGQPTPQPLKQAKAVTETK